MTDYKLSKIDSKALDLMEPGHGLTKKEAEELSNDAETKAQCAEVEAIATAIRMEREPIDVELELRRFHEKEALRPLTQPTPQKVSGSRGLRLGSLAAGIAAAIIAAIFLISKPQP